MGRKTMEGAGLKNRTMRREVMKIMEALTGVDEELLARCENADGGFEAQAGEGKPGWKHRWNKKRNLYLWRLSGCAALLCLLAAGALSWRELEKLSSGGTMYESKESRVFDNAQAQGYVVDGTVSDVFPEKENSVPMRPPVEAESPGEADGEAAVIRDLPGQVPKQETVNERLDEKTERKQSDEKDEVTDDAIQHCLTPDPMEELTEAEAGQVELLGGYIPAKLPEGYAFEEAYLTLENGSLTVIWHRGMDSMILNIRKVDGEAPEVVDVAKPESYDRRLYEIPYGKTVPGEYLKNFIRPPVFAKEDFSLEIVSSCVVSYSGDGGDTDTPRGAFAVLYDGVLVSFQGKGTPQQIWELFSSIRE